MEAIIVALATFPEAKKERRRFSQPELKKLKKRITLLRMRQKPQRPYFAARREGRAACFTDMLQS